MSILSHITNEYKTQADHLASYGWHIEDIGAWDTLINPGDTVYFYDDEDEEYRWGTFIRFYEDMPRNPDGDTSPYTNEAYHGIQRVVIREIILNPDGGYCYRTNYILPEDMTNQPHNTGHCFAEWLIA